MVGIEPFGLGCWIVIFVSFYMLRRAAWFSAASIAVIGAFVSICATGEARWFVNCVATTIGLTADWLGLLLIRAMLTRSISLNMLIGYAGGGKADFNESLASRLEDAAKYRLATCDGQRYVLGTFGRIVSVCVRVAYRVTGCSA